MPIFLSISDILVEIINALGIPVEFVEGGAVTILALVIFMLVKDRVADRKQDVQQLSLQQQTIKLASDANARSDKAIEVGEQSINTNKQLAVFIQKQTQVLTKFIQKQTQVMEGFNKRLDSIDVKVDTFPDMLTDFRTSFIKSSVTRVVVRDPNKNVISMFVARPETLPNGDQILVVDLGKVKRKVEYNDE